MEECKSCKKIDHLIHGLCYDCQCAANNQRESVSSQSSQLITVPTPCLCGTGAMTEKALILCTNCDKCWHPACVGLSGLTKTQTRNIKSWKCPMCFVFPRILAEKIKEDINVFPDGRPDSELDFQAEIKKGVKAAVPDIVSGIKEALTEARVNDAVSWAEVANAKKLITEVVEETSKTALQKSIQLIDSNLTDQKKRVRNAIMSGVSENSREGEATLKDVVAEHLDGDINDIVTVKRLGEKKVGVSRFILVVFKSEEAALYYHNYGRGRNVAENIWVNPDLTRTEREAMFKKRDERRKRSRQHHTRPPVRTLNRESVIEDPSTLSQSRRGSSGNLSQHVHGAVSPPVETVLDENSDTRDAASNHE